MIIVCSALLICVLAIFFYMRRAEFGKAPSGECLEFIKQSPNFKNGKFQNVHYTPMMTEGYSMVNATYDFLLKKFPRQKPTDSQ